jgi:hypothetical protein
VVALFQPTGNSTTRRLAQAYDTLEYASVDRRLGYLMSEEHFHDAIGDALEGQERHLVKQEEEDQVPGDRRLQQQVCQLYFNNTIFRNNTQGATSGATTYGVVTALSAGSFLSFSDCIFYQNIFGIRAIYVSIKVMKLVQ